jgi:hypothetical protein
VAIGSGVVSLALVAAILAGHHRDRAVDRTTVKGAFAEYVAIADRGDWQALYPMMVRDLRDKIEMTHQNLRRTAEMIETSYPAALRRQALADLGHEELRRAATPAAFFAARVGASGRVAMSFEDRMGSRLKRIVEDQKAPGRFLVTTISGATIEFVKGGDGLFDLVPDPTDVQQIHREYLRSIETLDATRQAVNTFGGAAAR